MSRPCSPAPKRRRSPRWSLLVPWWPARPQPLSWRVGNRRPPPTPIISATRPEARRRGRPPVSGPASSRSASEHRRLDPSSGPPRTAAPSDTSPRAAVLPAMAWSSTRRRSITSDSSPPMSPPWSWCCRSWWSGGSRFRRQLSVGWPLPSARTSIVWLTVPRGSPRLGVGSRRRESRSSRSRCSRTLSNSTPCSTGSRMPRRAMSTPIVGTRSSPTVIPPTWPRSRRRVRCPRWNVEQ